MERKHWVIESQFEYCDLPCVVVFQRLGHRCGYVGVDKDHALYNVDYQDVWLDENPHGGLTYSGSSHGDDYPIAVDYWWFGFDCAHFGDLQDMETAIEYFPDDPEVQLLKSSPWRRYAFEEWESIKTKEFVEEECRKLARQLAEQRKPILIKEEESVWEKE